MIWRLITDGELVHREERNFNDQRSFTQNGSARIKSVPRKISVNSRNGFREGSDYGYSNRSGPFHFKHFVNL